MLIVNQIENTHFSKTDAEDGFLQFMMERLFLSSAPAEEEQGETEGEEEAADELDHPWVLYTIYNRIGGGAAQRDQHSGQNAQNSEVGQGASGLSHADVGVAGSNVSGGEAKFHVVLSFPDS